MAPMQPQTVGCRCDGVSLSSRCGTSRPVSSNRLFVRSKLGAKAASSIGPLSRRQANHVLRASAGDGGGSGGSSGGSGGGGGGGGDDGDDGEPEPAPAPKKGVAWKGWEDRVAADPQFVDKVFIEQVIGVGASVLGDMSSRPNWGLSELDFVFATLVVGSIVNFSLMYFLAPTGAAAAAGRTSLLQDIFSEKILRSWGAPGGHLFQPGFPVSKRVVNFLYKGCVFAFVGLCAGTIGTATSNGLLVLRKALDPSFETQNTPPSVLGNASCWALHMGVSSNLRYQILNGIDMVVQPALSPTAFRVFASIIRTVNNAAGGISFVVLAKLFGVQKSAEAEPALAAVEAPAAKGKAAKK